jgi:predicted RNA-binding Zn-ribbon protein involved in translation (DUF1610 family)
VDVADLQEQFAARVTRPWKIALVLYALAWATGTHWPQLQLGTEELPVSDKLVHAAAFGGLLVLLLRSRWLRRPTFAALVVLGWAAIDELSQGIPGLGRTGAFDDLLADACGIAVILAVTWAFRPRGRGPARMHERRWRFAIDRLFTRKSSWAIVVGSGLLGMGVGVPISYSLTFLFINPNPPQAIVIGAILGFLATSLFAVEVLRQREIGRMKREWPCFECATPSTSPSSAKPSVCSACGAVIHPAQWDDPPRPSPAWFGVIVLLGFIFWWMSIVGMFLLGITMVYFRRLHAWATAVDDFYKSLGPDMSVVIDATVIALLASAAISWIRGRVASRLDRQEASCVRCGYDLHATEAVGGRGMCPECGQAFVGARAGAALI